MASRSLDRDRRCDVVELTDNEDPVHAVSACLVKHSVERPRSELPAPCTGPDPVPDVTVLANEIVLAQPQRDAAHHLSGFHDPPTDATMLGGSEALDPRCETGARADVVRRCEAEAVLVKTRTPFPVCHEPSRVQRDVGRTSSGMSQG